MAIQVSLDQVIDSYRGKTKTIRRQHCSNCKLVIAIQATDKVESMTEGDYWIIAGGIVIRREFEALYQRSGRWFGNPVKCPKCLWEGHLPMDKPASWEEMKKQREVGNV